MFPASAPVDEISIFVPAAIVPNDISVLTLLIFTEPVAAVTSTLCPACTSSLLSLEPTLFPAVNVIVPSVFSPTSVKASCKMLFPALTVMFPDVASISAASVTSPVFASSTILVPAVVSPFINISPPLAVTLIVPSSAPIALSVISPVVLETETSPPVEVIVPEVWLTASCAIIVTSPEAVILFDTARPFPLSTRMYPPCVVRSLFIIISPFDERSIFCAAVISPKVTLSSAPFK